MGKIELIALDLDGTALQPDNTVAAQTRAAVQRARAAGIRVVVATGRISGEAREFAQAMDADNYMVTSGGATLSTVDDGRCFMRVSIPWEDGVRAAAAVERIGMTAMIYRGSRLIITPYDDQMFSRYKSNEGFLVSKQVVPAAAAYLAQNRLEIDKIFVRSHQPMQLQRVRETLSVYTGLRVISSASDNLEIMSPAADKGMALGLLCKLLGTDLAHCAAIGDSENDLELLQAVGLPIAMGNAAEQVKAVCRRVTDTNARHGVAQAIDAILAEK